MSLSVVSPRHALCQPSLAVTPSLPAEGSTSA